MVVQVGRKGFSLRFGGNVIFYTWRKRRYGYKVIANYFGRKEDETSAKLYILALEAARKRYA